MISTESSPPSHPRVSDLQHLRDETEDGSVFEARLRGHAGDCSVRDQSGERLRLTAERADLVDRWGTDRAAEIEGKLEVARATLDLARGVMAIVVHAFARGLAVTPYVDEFGAFPSATHALVDLMRQVDPVGGDQVAVHTRRERVLVLAQAEWLRLGDRAAADTRSAAGAAQAFAAEERAVKLEERVAAIERQPMPKPQVPSDADPSIRIALVLRHRPTSRKSVAHALGMSRSNVSNVTASGFEPAPDFGAYAIRPTPAAVDNLSKQFDMDALPEWCVDAVKKIEKSCSSRRRNQRSKSRRKAPYSRATHRVHPT